jgi:hypothetical protein
VDLTLFPWIDWRFILAQLDSFKEIELAKRSEPRYLPKARVEVAIPFGCGCDDSGGVPPARIECAKRFAIPLPSDRIRAN